MERYDGLSNADVAAGVDLWIRGERNRRMVKRFLDDADAPADKIERYMEYIAEA